MGSGEFAHLIAAPLSEHIENAPPHRIGLEEAAVEEDRRGGDEGDPLRLTLPISHESAERSAGAHVLRAAGEKEGEVTAEGRVGLVGEPQLPQPPGGAAGRMLGNGGWGQKAVEKDALQHLPAKLRRDGPGEETSTAARDGNRDLVQVGALEEALLARPARVQKKEELACIELLPPGFESGPQGVGQGEVHVVPPQKDVIPDADALQHQVPPFLPHRHQAEVRRPSPDVADEDDVSRTHRLAPPLPRKGEPVVEGGLLLLKQAYFHPPGRLGRLVGELAGHLVEGGRHRQNRLAPLDPLSLSKLLKVMRQCSAQMKEIAPGRLEWGDLSLLKLRGPG